MNLTLEKQISNTGTAYQMNGILMDSMFEGRSGSLKKINAGSQDTHTWELGNQETKSPVGSYPTSLKSPFGRVNDENLEIAVVDEVRHHDSEYLRSMVGNNQTVDSSFTNHEGRFNSGTLPELAAQPNIDRFQNSFSRQDERANTSLGGITDRQQSTQRSLKIGNIADNLDIKVTRTISTPANHLGELARGAMQELKDASQERPESRLPTMQDINTTKLGGESVTMQSAVVQKHCGLYFNFNYMGGSDILTENALSYIKFKDQIMENNYNPEHYINAKLEEVVNQSPTKVMQHVIETGPIASQDKFNMEDRDVLALFESKKNLQLPQLHLLDNPQKSPNQLDSRTRSPMSVGSAYFKTPQLVTIPSRRDSELELTEEESASKENIPLKVPDSLKKSQRIEPLTTQTVLKLTSELKVKNYNPYSLAEPEAYHAIDKMANVSMNMLKPTKELWEVLDCIVSFDSEPLPHLPGSGPRKHYMMVTVFENALHNDEGITSASNLEQALKSQSMLTTPASMLRKTILTYSKLGSDSVVNATVHLDPGESSPSPKYISEFSPSYAQMDIISPHAAKEQSTKPQPPVSMDILVVVDNSQMMEPYLHVVKSQLMSSLQSGLQGARIAIVTCSTNRGLSPGLDSMKPADKSTCTWILINAANQDKISNSISPITTDANTDLQHGLECALKLIKTRRKTPDTTCMFVFSAQGKITNRDTCLLGNISKMESDWSQRGTPSAGKTFSLKPKYTGTASPSPRVFSIPSEDLTVLPETKVPQVFCLGIGPSHDGKILWDLARNRGGHYYDFSYPAVLTRLGERITDCLNAAKSVVVNTVSVSLSLYPSNPVFRGCSLISSQPSTPATTFHHIGRDWKHSLLYELSFDPSDSPLLKECPVVLGSVRLEYEELGGRRVRVDKSICCWVSPQKEQVPNRFGEEGALEMRATLDRVARELQSCEENLGKGCFMLASEQIDSVTKHVKDCCRKGMMLVDLLRLLTNLQNRMSIEEKQNGYAMTSEKNSIRNQIVQISDHLHRQELYSSSTFKPHETSASK